MSEHTAKTTGPATDTPADDTEARPSIEKRVERIASYWGRALADACRVVFSPREDHR